MPAAPKFAKRRSRIIILAIQSNQHRLSVPLRTPCLCVGFFLSLALLIPTLSATVCAQPDDPLVASLEAARRTRDTAQLESLQAQLQQRLARNPNDALSQYQLACVESYLVDVADARKDKKAATAALERAIDAVQRSIQLNDNSADAHSLLADLYGRKISLGTTMFAGSRFGPKVGEQNKRALALDDKNPRVWASLGRQYLTAPKAFGGDIPKAIDSFQKSLALDPTQDETWVWLAKAYEKQPDKPKARDALRRALQLNPQSPMAQEAFKSLER
jgi:cytochrome c-type biogenesis protein CcmH/NrfG